MSVVLSETHRSELPLIVFTMFVPAAEGLCLCALMGGSASASALLAVVLTTVGMIASVAHLAKPLRAPRSLMNLASSWLSREIIAVSVFWAILVAWCAAAMLGEGAPTPEEKDLWTMVAFIAQGIASIAGAIVLFVIARAYHVSTRPAWGGYAGLAEMWACALSTGSLGVLLIEMVTSPQTILLEGASFPDHWLALCSLTVALSLAGAGIDVAACRARLRRLVSLRAFSDERIPLTLERYERSMPRLKRLWWAEVLCATFVAVAGACQVLGGVPLVALILCFAAFCGQLIIHGLIRDAFYDLPVQVRFVAPLKK